MSYQEAMTALNEGNLVKRRGWPVWLERDNNGTIHVISDDYEAVEWHPLPNDLAARDWVIKGA